MNPEYDQIISRFSVRRYDQQKINPDQLEKLRKNIPGVQPLNDSNNFFCEVFDYDSRSRESGALGPYGKIFSAPYFLAPHITGGLDSIIDLGFRTQQIILDLWSEGVGSCYIGCIHQQHRVVKLLDLPENAHIISLVAFGIPSEDQSRRLYQKVSQAFTRSKKRMSYEELFIGDSFSMFEDQSTDLKKIIDAGRQAPSATNAQPWRFQFLGDYFQIYTKKKAFGRIYDSEQEYSLHDTGICRANMSLAARSIGRNLDWDLCFLPDQISDDNLLPVGRFKISSLEGK